MPLFPSLALPTRRLKATLQRLRRLTETYSQLMLDAYAGRAEVMGRALGLERERYLGGWQGGAGHVLGGVSGRVPASGQVQLERPQALRRSLTSTRRAMPLAAHRSTVEQRIHVGQDLLSLVPRLTDVGSHVTLSTFLCC